MAKQKKWIKARHRVVCTVVRVLLYPYLKIKYRVNIEKFRAVKDEPYLILYNHQTPDDQFMLGSACPVPLYYVATEDIFSMGWISGIISWAVAPIPFKKSGHDMRAIKSCMRVAKEGGSIALAPEGNRTYSGETCYIKPSIVKFIRALQLPVAFFLFEGGYGKQPRWSNVTRSGDMKLSVRRVVSVEEYSAMSDDELYELVVTNMYHDDSEYPAINYHPRTAEYLERLIYVCPECGLSEFRSDKDRFKCLGCGLEVKYTEDKNFVREGDVFTFNNVRDWYRYQNDRINRLDMEQYRGILMYEDTADIYEVIPYEKKKLLMAGAKAAIYGDKITLETGVGEITEMPMESIASMACCGRNKLNIYADRTYQLKGSVRFNPVKYMNLMHRYKNQNGLGGTEDAEFLGL